MSAADRLIPIFRNNAGTALLSKYNSTFPRGSCYAVSTFVTGSKLFERGVTMSVNTESEDFLTARDVWSSILQVHRGFRKNEPFTSESHERNFERT